MYKSQLNSVWDDSHLEPVGCVRSVAALALLQGQLLAAHFDGVRWMFLGHDNKWHSINQVLEMVRVIDTYVNPPFGQIRIRSRRSKTFAAALYLLQATEEYYSNLPEKVVPLPPIIDFCYMGC